MTREVDVEQKVPSVRKEVEDLAAWLLTSPRKEGSAETREIMDTKAYQEASETGNASSKPSMIRALKQRMYQGVGGGLKTQGREEPDVRYVQKAQITGERRSQMQEREITQDDAKKCRENLEKTVNRNKMPACKREKRLL